MMNSNYLKLYLVFFIASVFSTLSFAQEWKRELIFRNISTEDGLSNPSINCFYEDQRGFIWIGTKDGLNRYDGNEFKVYRPDIADSNSISGSDIYVLIEDNDYNLWIGTENGLCQFNYNHKKFTNYKSDFGSNLVMDILYDTRNNRIWMATWSGGLKFLDLETGVINDFYSNALENALPIKLLLVHDELLIGTSNNGVYKLNLDSFLVEEFCNTKAGLFQIPSNDINALHFYRDNLLIGTDGGGLVRYDFKANKQIIYTPQNSFIPSFNISSIDHDSNGYMYIGTNNGLIVYDKYLELISLNNKEEGNSSAIASNDINTLYIDNNDDFWVGTAQNGVAFNGSESKNMTLVKKSYTNKNSLSGSNVLCIEQDRNGGMWIGTKDEGLNYYKNGEYTHFKADESEGALKDNNIQDICIDKSGTVWLATIKNGIASYENGKFVHFVNDQNDPNSIQSNIVRKLDIDKQGNLWLATSKGLESFELEKKVFTHHFLDRGNNDLSKRFNIRTFLLADDGNIYLGTSTGFYIYDPISKKSERFLRDQNDINSLGHSMIYEIFEDTQKRIWLGSRGWGLIRFHRESKTFKSYNQSNGFPDNFVKSIEDDDRGDLWIGTNKGIVKFTPSNEQAEFFGLSFGLQDNQFNRRASIKCDDGRLVFGGIEGFNVFRADELKLDKEILDVIITDLKIFDESVPVSGEHNILSQNISLVNSVDIQYDQSKHFSISFSALQFSNPKQVEYAYKLEGFEDEWKYIGNELQVSFTNLEPAEYVLKVMASDNGKWNNNIKELVIRIPAPWYMTIWFKSGLVVGVILLLALFYVYKVHTHKEQKRILERLVDEQNYEITSQNEELTSNIEALSIQNEEVIKQKEQINIQNKELTIIHEELNKTNQTLEERVAARTKELKESNIKLNKTVMDLDRFVYSASHDLSAPLKSVLGLVNIAKLESKDKTLEVHLNYIEESIKKQEKVIRSLIQYSRNSRQTVKIRKLELSDLVDQIISELRYMPGADHVEIFNEVPSNTIINSDEQRILTILNNLISNGINYRGIDNVKSFIKIQFIADKHAWKLIVKDNGQGVAEDQKEKIFEMFHRANLESEGSGLGLFIVKEAADRLDGKISLESALALGSEFVFDFPYL